VEDSDELECAIKSIGRDSYVAWFAAILHGTCPDGRSLLGRNGALRHAWRLFSAVGEIATLN
jgi:hypothetical protein